MGRYQHIVAATDFSEPADRAAAAAASLARSLGSKVSLVHVYDPWPYTPPGFPVGATEADASMAKGSAERLERLRAAQFDGIETEVEALRHHNAAVAVTDYAGEVGAKLCVVGTHGRTGLSRVLAGSVAERVVRHAPCDVLSVPATKADATDALPIKHVMVGTDFSDPSKHAMDAAKWIGDKMDAELTLVHALDSSDETGPGLEESELKRRLWDALSTIRAERFAKNPRVNIVVLDGDSAATAMCEHAADKGVDLLVVGSHGRTGLERLLIGSVAERVVRFASCPVWVVRTHPVSVTK
jgi:nucleotide-binding universal stress UspA family protein